MFFLSNPIIAFEEIGDLSVAITEHNNLNNSFSGRFCVQFNYFKNDKDGLEVLEWWRDSCIEWCFARYEDGKYGDQKYLDEFPERSKNLCIIKNKGVGIAPWNMYRYKFYDSVLKFEGNEYQPVFVHMHGLKAFIKKNTLYLKCVDCTIDRNAKHQFFDKYAELLMDVYNNYLDKNVSSYRILQKSKLRIYLSKIKKLLRNNMFIRWIYYEVLKVKYNGHESKQI